MSKAAKKTEKDDTKNEKNRGTKDEFETVVAILQENHGIKMRVLDTIRKKRDEKKNTKGPPKAV